ncbi:MAG: OmpH family outer membrane protein [Bacteroidota bacterium]
MKHLLICLILALVFAQPALAQKFGYFDSKFVLEKMPEYKKAKGEIDKASADWQKEVEAKLAEVTKMRKEYLAEEILLNDDMKKERTAAIAVKDKEAKERQAKVFGFEGLLFLKRQELIKPVQDKLYEAVEKVCKQKKLAIMYDKSADIGMIYTDTRHDYTDYILEELGLGDKNDKVDNEKVKPGEK